MEYYWHSSKKSYTGQFDEVSPLFFLINISQRFEFDRNLNFSIHDVETHCNKIGILRNGEFLCIDNPLGIKERFAKGCTINLRFTRETSEKDLVKLKGAIAKSNPDWYLAEDHTQYLEYHVHDLRVHQILTDIEYFSEAQKYLIEYFTIKESPLESIVNDLM